MFRTTLKKQTLNKKTLQLLDRYKISREYIAINRKTVTRAFAIGIFIALIPMPFQMLVIVGLVFFIKFNVPLALLMIWISNPLTMPIIFYIEYATGAFLLGKEIAAVEMTTQWFRENYHNIFISLYTGAFFYAILSAILIYYISSLLWRYSVRRERKSKNLKKEIDPTALSS